MSYKDEDLRDVVRKEKREKEAAAKVVINREETCPLLLRVFTSTARHNDIKEYDRGSTPENEVQIYTWMDATLKELTGLIKEVNNDARRRGTYFNFKVVAYDLRISRYHFRDIGTTVAGNKGVDDELSLMDSKFTIGDYLDVSITPPNQRNDRMDYGRRGGGGDRFGGGRGGPGRRFNDDRRDFDRRDNDDRRDFDRRDIDERRDDRRDRGDRMGDDRRDRGDERRERGGGRDRDIRRDRSL